MLQDNLKQKGKELKRQAKECWQDLPDGLRAAIVLITLILIVVAVTGCASGWDGMTQAERQRYNTGPFQPECRFDEAGTPDRSRCNDFRLINHKSNNAWEGARLATGEGFFYRPTTPGPMPDDVHIPDGLKIVWHDRVSSTEATCYQLMKRTEPRPQFYPTACYDPIFKEAHVTYGDWVALKHEIRHFTEGRFHD